MQQQRNEDRILDAHKAPAWAILARVTGGRRVTSMLARVATQRHGWTIPVGGGVTHHVLVMSGISPFFTGRRWTVARWAELPDGRVVNLVCVDEAGEYTRLEYAVSAARGHALSLALLPGYRVVCPDCYQMLGRDELVSHAC